jgi:methylmalonyl-CoA/ethylmalonyl-CoA epimerase
MFSDIHHISYLVPSLDAAIGTYAETFGATVTGRGTVPNLGEVAFLQAGEVEVEFICPVDPSTLEGANGNWVVHHIAYAVEDLDQVVAEHRRRGYRFLTDEPFTNFMGYRLIYFDPADTGGCLVHLTDKRSLARGGNE